MPRFLRLLPLLIVALWLPLQTVAAATMPFCEHAPAAPAAPQHEHAAAAHDHAGPAAGADHDHHAAHHDPQAAQASAIGCDACGTCHLACASVLPTAAVTRQAPELRDSHAVPPAPTFTSHTPLPKDRPPRTA